MTISQLARWAMQAEQKLTPLIIAKQFPPLEALALITMQTKSLAWGKDEIGVTEEEVGAFAGLILACWKEGLFTDEKNMHNKMRIYLNKKEKYARLCITNEHIRKNVAYLLCTCYVSAVANKVFCLLYS